MSDRDYLADMNAAIEQAVPDGDYAAPVVAAELVAHLRETDPELLAGWLDLRAEIYVADTIARRSNSKRQTARHQMPRRAFAEAARSFEASGEAVVLKPFAFEYVVDAANTRRQVGQMTAADCLFVADRYEDTARAAKLEASFHRAVAKKVGLKTVGDVFSEEQYLSMYQSVTGRAQVAAAA